MGNKRRVLEKSGIVTALSDLRGVFKERRLSFDEKWMCHALVNSLRSSDPKRKVGCIIVSLDNKRTISQGYNGDEPGGSNKRKSLETGESGFLHAEENALIMSDGTDQSDKKLYTTLSPCYTCAQRIVLNSTIKEVIYLESYDELALKLLKKNGIRVRKW